MPPSNDAPTKDRPAWSRAARFLRIVAIGRNPKVTLVRIVVVVVMALVVFKLILLPIRVSGISMFPTYKDRSINFVNRLAYVRHKPRRGDVVGIRVAGSDTPGRAPGLMFMKRVVGLPGEIISFSRGHLFVDGAMLDEPYVNGPCNWNALPVQIGSNQYYAVGDNRSMPIEFHDHGRVDRARIVGKVLF